LPPETNLYLTKIVANSVIIEYDYLKHRYK